MATIQLRRKTTSGSGPLTGTSGTIKQGEPLIDLNGGNLYIAKANKTGSSSNPLSASDYFEFVNSNNLTSVLNSKINELDLGTASKYDVGNGEGQIPVVDSDGFLSSSIIPRIAITNTFVVSSQNEMLKLSQAETGDICIRNDLSKTFILKGEPYSTLGAVNISLSELGGVSTSTFNSHKSDNTHLNAVQREQLENMYISEIIGSRAAIYDENASNFDSNTINNGLYIRSVYDECYNMKNRKFEIGINKSAVLTPSSTIDGGTY